jgi:hypothetical protein
MRLMRYLFFFMIVALALYVISNVFHRPARESIMFFPIDPAVQFTQAKTELSLQSKKNDDRYIIDWLVTSNLDRPAYLRQDISLLFANGRLLATQSKWKENGQMLIQEKKIEQKDSRLFQAISYHQGELHNNNDIRSSQKMSGDRLYVIDSPFMPLQSFRTPRSPSEKEWEQTLNKTTKALLEYTTKKASDHFSLQKDQYYHLYLPELIAYNEQPFMDLTLEQTERMIGNLWEGLYKNYFLGIKKRNGTTVSPIGSTIPLILISKDYRYLLVITETADGEPIRLIQLLQFPQ